MESVSMSFRGRSTTKIGLMVHVIVLASLLFLWLLTPANYADLEYALKAKDWEAANEQTASIILRVSGRGGLTGSWSDLIGQENSLAKFPCKDVALIDSLWVKYSNDHFGLRVQKGIFNSFKVEDFGGNWFAVYTAFLKTVGWEDLGEDSFSEIYDINAPKGHLPSGRWMVSAGNVKTNPWIENGLYLFQRIDVCQPS